MTTRADKISWGSYGNVFVDLAMPNARELLDLAERTIASKGGLEDFQNEASRLGFDLKAEAFTENDDKDKTQ